MIGHPSGEDPFLDPGCGGLICLLAAPALALFGVGGLGMVIGCLAVFGILIFVGLVSGKR